MKTIKVSEATGPALDWLVARIEGCEFEAVESFLAYHDDDAEMRYCTDWDIAGPIIEREGLTVRHMGGDFRNEWLVRKGDGHWEGDWFGGPTPLIAACRCFVASRLGQTVEVPEEL